MPAGMHTDEDKRRRAENAARQMHLDYKKDMEMKNKSQLRSIGRQGPPTQASSTNPSDSQRRDPQQVVSIHAKPKWLADKEAADMQANEVRFQERMTAAANATERLQQGGHGAPSLKAKGIDPLGSNRTTRSSPSSGEQAATSGGRDRSSDKPLRQRVFRPQKITGRPRGRGDASSRSEGSQDSIRSISDQGRRKTLGQSYSPGHSRSASSSLSDLTPRTATNASPRLGGSMQPRKPGSYPTRYSSKDTVPPERTEKGRRGKHTERQKSTQPRPERRQAHRKPSRSAGRRQDQGGHNTRAEPKAKARSKSRPRSRPRSRSAKSGPVDSSSQQNQSSQGKRVRDKNS